MHIRPFEDRDTQPLAVLFQDMQAHYAVFCPPLKAIVAGLRNRPVESEILLAECDGEIRGFAAFSAIYPGPGLRPGFFLKELYVSEANRGTGIGKALLARLAKLAIERGLHRIDWTALRCDHLARAFYDRLGGEAKEDRVFYRLEGDALKRLGE